MWAPQEGRVCQTEQREEADWPALCRTGRGSEPLQPTGYCRPGFIVSVSATCLSRPDAVWALAPGPEGRVQLLSDVPHSPGLPVNQRGHRSEEPGKRTMSTGSGGAGDTHMVEVGLGGRFSGQQSSVGEGRPSESSLSRWT